MKFIQLFIALLFINSLQAQFSFDKKIIEQNTIYNNETAVGDFDNNGELDIIVTSYSGGEVNIYFQKNKILTKKNILKNLTQPSLLIVSDFNKDGKLDFVISFGPSSNLFTFLNDGSGINFTQKLGGNSSGSSPVEITSFDINKDGYEDFIVGFAPSGIKMFINKKDGTFDRYNVSNDFKRPGGLILNDFNKDNKLDIVATSFFGNEVTVFFGNGGNIPTFFAESVDKSISSPNGCAVTDINNDGKNDIIVSSFGSDKLFYYTYDGIFFTKIEISTISDPTQISVLDLNKDGYKDIVCYEQGKKALKIFTTKNDGVSFESYTLDETNKTNAWTTFVDWDKDNDIDIIVPCESSLMYFENKTLVSSNEEYLNISVNIFPNPAVEVVNIECEGFRSCKIWDLSGREILTTTTNIIDVSFLQNGLYCLIIHTNTNKIVKKFYKI